MNETTKQTKNTVRMGKPSRPVQGRDEGRFHLDGVSHSFDPRVEAIRADLADVELADRHFAPHYAKAVKRTAIEPRTPIFKKPDAESEMISELLYGEGFALLDVTSGWAWGYTLHDHYVGYVDVSALGPYAEPTHRVIASTAIDGGVTLPIGALVNGNANIAADNLAPLGDVAADPVATIEPLLDVPYLWGGRSNEGIDCSGLVQLMLARAGIAAPRDSDLQLEGLSGDIAEGEDLQRGDIIFFPDHVGVMTDATTLLHATQHYGKVASEPLADVVSRMEAEGRTPAVLGRKRVLKG